MIKIGEIQVDKNLNPKIFLFCTILSLFIFIFASYFVISNMIKTKDYIMVYATRVDTYFKINSTADNNTTYYEVLNYNYNNKDYSISRQILSSTKKYGAVVTIYVNPDNPTEVRDTYNINVSIIVSIFSLLCCILSFTGYKQRMKLENS